MFKTTLKVFLITILLSPIVGVFMGSYKDLSNLDSITLQRRVGDVAQVALPLSIGVLAVATKNPKLFKDFAAYFVVNTALTHSLKATIREERPNNPNRRDSFPSGHTAAAFSAPVFLHHNFGGNLYAFTATLPLYATASYVGYSRVVSNRHHIQDIFGGIATAIASLYIVELLKRLYRRIRRSFNK